jgi:RecB family exonuclease
VLDPTSSEQPVRPADEPLALSGSQLSGLSVCPLRWFLEHESSATVARTTALGFGSIVHVLADHVARGELPPDLDVLEDQIDRVWGELGFEATWQSTVERREASLALQRFLSWHSGRPERTFVASEHQFDVELPVGEHGVRLRGSFDRVEVDADGGVHVADLKTSKSKPTGTDLERHPQLGVYQAAVLAGALDPLPDDVRAAAGLPDPGQPVPVAGAELVMLRLDAHGDPTVAAQDALPVDGSWVDTALTDVDARVRREDFVARPGTQCRFCALRRTCPASDEGQEVLP